MLNIFIGGVMVGAFIAAVYVGNKLGNRITDLEMELAREKAKHYGA